MAYQRKNNDVNRNDMQTRTQQIANNTLNNEEMVSTDMTHETQNIKYSQCHIKE